MSRNIIGELYKVSLAAVYLLPLLDMNIDTFGANNFLDCQVSRDGRFLAVKVKDLLEVEDPYHCPHYATDTTTSSGEHFIVFHIPERWRHTFEKFCEGKYSQFTERAKTTIIKNCGLSWKDTTTQGKVTTDARLMALYRNPELRKLIEYQIDTAIDEDSELVSPPKPTVFFGPELVTAIKHLLYPSL